MVDNPFYSHEFHGEYEIASIGRLELEEGGVIPDCHLAYTTWGELNEARDNAILILTGLAWPPGLDDALAQLATIVGH